MKKVLDGPVVVLPREKNNIDVFTGMGWENYSQFEIINGFPKLRKGKALAPADYKHLLELLKK